MLTTVVEDINKQLEPLGLKVARMKSRNGSDSGAFQLYYGVVNLDEEDGWGKQGWLSKSEQEFFHKLVGEILGSDEKRVEASDATNLGRDLTSTSKLTASDAGKCLEKLELGQWLFKSDDGFYSLGVRTELQRRYMSEEPKDDGSSQPATQAP